MDAALALRSLWRSKLLVLLAILVSAAVGIVASYRVTLSPFKLENRGVEFAVGGATILVDGSRSPLGDATRSIQPLIQRAQIVTASLGGAEVRRRLAQRAGLDVNEVAVGSLGGGGVRDPAADQRAAQIVERGEPYQVVFRPTADSPVITVSTQAPTVQEASELARNAVIVARSYIQDTVLASSSTDSRVVLRALDPPAAGVVNPDGATQAAIVIGAGTFVGLLFVILLIGRLRQDLGQQPEAPGAEDADRIDAEDDDAPAVDEPSGGRTPEHSAP